MSEETDYVVALRSALKAAYEMLRAIRPLVEEAECKRRIVDAGCNWIQWSCGVLRVHVNGRGVTPTQDCATWPEGAEWAKAQAPKRERWSEPVAGMNGGDINATYGSLGALVGDFVPQNADGLRGYAAARQLWAPGTDRIRLPEVPK